MISQHKSTSTVDQSVQDARIAEVLSDIQTSRDPYYGRWLRCDGEADVLRAVVTEVGSVMLPRAIFVAVRETGREFVLTISNRHLLDVSGLPGDVSEGTAAQVVAWLRQMLAGARHVKFEISDRAPDLPSGARSWSHHALLEALFGDARTSVGGSAAGQFLAAVKAKSIEWIDVESGARAGTAQGSALDVMCAHVQARRAREAGQVPKCHTEPRCVMMAHTAEVMMIEVEVEDMLVLALCAKSERANIVALWRDFLKAACPEA